MTTRIIGIGNPWASDDGVGLEVVRRLQVALQEKGPASRWAALEFQLLTEPGLELLDALDSCQVAVIVDAVSGQGSPGKVHRVEWDSGALRSRLVERASSHGFGVREVLELAAALGRLPARVELWGIEIASTEPGEGLSPPVAAALPRIVGNLLQALEG